MSFRAFLQPPWSVGVDILCVWECLSLLVYLQRLIQPLLCYPFLCLVTRVCVSVAPDNELRRGRTMPLCPFESTS